jgi:hypothetical protein
MASILIEDINYAGSSFFQDDESFLGDLSDELGQSVKGGITPSTISPASPQIGAAAVASFIASAGFSYVVVKNWTR